MKHIRAHNNIGFMTEQISPEASMGDNMVEIAFSIQDMNSEAAKSWATQKFIQEFFNGDQVKYSNWLNHAIKMER